MTLFTGTAHRHSIGVLPDVLPLGLHEQIGFGVHPQPGLLDTVRGGVRLAFEHFSCAFSRDCRLAVVLACSLVCASTLAVGLGPSFVHLSARELQLALGAESTPRPQSCLLREHASLVCSRSLALRLPERRLALDISRVVLIVAEGERGCCHCCCYERRGDDRCWAHDQLFVERALLGSPAQRNDSTRDIGSICAVGPLPGSGLGFAGEPYSSLGLARGRRQLPALPDESSAASRSVDSPRVRLWVGLEGWRAGGKTMEIPPSIIPPDEDARLAAVHRYEVLDTPCEGAFDRITALAARLFSVPIAIVSIVDNDRVWFKSRHGIDLEQVSRLPGLCASAILQREPLILPDASVDPNALANPIVAGELGLRFYAGASLTTWDGHNLGAICVLDKEPREFGDEDVSTLEQLAQIVVHELELRIVTRNVVKSERETRVLEAARRGLEAAEHERTRWARELHDETLQNLGALHMLLMSGRADREGLDATVGEAANLVQDEIVKLRHLIAELRPAVLDHVGLEAALESLGRKLRVIDGLEVELNLEISQVREYLGADAESMLYRAVQEALANVARHAAARRVEVAVRAREGAIEAIVRDDGVGFEAGSARGGFGLLGMRERAMLMGGELDLQTAPGAGTTVRFVMPLGEASSVEDRQSSSP